MRLSDLYVVLFALVYAVLVGVTVIGLDLAGVDLATLLTGILFILFVAVGVVLRSLLGMEW